MGPVSQPTDVGSPARPQGDGEELPGGCLGAHNKYCACTELFVWRNVVTAELHQDKKGFSAHLSGVPAAVYGVSPWKAERPVNALWAGWPMKQMQQAWDGMGPHYPLPELELYTSQRQFPFIFRVPWSQHQRLSVHSPWLRFALTQPCLSSP